MKDIIIKIASDLEFKSKLLSTKPMKYSHKEDVRYYLWLCELEEWIRVTYWIVLFKHPFYDKSNSKITFAYDIVYPGQRKGVKLLVQDTPALALEAAIFEMLNLIIKK